MSNLFFRPGSPIGIAHRGSRLLWPENTLTAFSGAADLGCRFFETDVRVTADGVLVCFHDPRLERTTNGTGALVDLRWEDLARLDAGHHHRLHQGFPFRGTGIRVPRLADLVTEFPYAGLVVDLKADGTEEPLVELVTELAIGDRIVVGSFSDRRLRRFRALTEGATSAGPEEILRALIGGTFGRLLDGPARAFQVPVSWYGVPVVTSRFLHAVHGAGKLVHVWTVNSPPEMRRLLDLGVDGIITDRPDLLAPLLAPKTVP